MQIGSVWDNALRGKTVLQRVEALINVAHPDFRAELRAEANRLHIW